MQPPIILVGTWTVGDTLKDYEHTSYRRDGTLFDFTGYTGRFVGRSRDNRANKLDEPVTFNVPATDGISLVSGLGNALTLTPGKRLEIYVCNFVWTRTADSRVLKSRPVSVAIAADALVM